MIDVLIFFKYSPLIVTLSTDDEAVVANGFIVQRLDHSNVTTDAVDDKMTLRVASNQ